MDPRTHGPTDTDTHTASLRTVDRIADERKDLGRVTHAQLEPHLPGQAAESNSPGCRGMVLRLRYVPTKIVRSLPVGRRSALADAGSTIRVAVSTSMVS
eukprot:2480369-Rhodomonas_salina.1